MDIPDVDGYGDVSEDWMEVEERKEFIDMSQTPGSALVKFHGHPRKMRSKYGKDQFWFAVDLVIDREQGTTGERILSTASSKLRAGIKKMLEKYPDLLQGDRLVVIQWTGAGMDRSYDVAVVENPWK